MDPDEPLPSTLEQMEQQASEKREERMQVQKRQQEQEKARKAFTNPWLIGMETQMAECNRRLEGTENAEMRAVLTSLLEININKLRLFHQNQGTLGKHEALTERKKLCLERGLVEKSCVDCIGDVFSPLPARDSAVGQCQYREQQCQCRGVVYPTGKRERCRQL